MRSGGIGSVCFLRSVGGKREENLAGSPAVTLHTNAVWKTQGLFVLLPSTLPSSHLMKCSESCKICFVLSSCWISY